MRLRPLCRGAGAAKLCAREEASLNLDPVNATVCVVYALAQEDYYLAHLPASTTATIVVAVPANACVPLENAADVAGNFVVIDRGDCGFDIKEGFAVDAGAAAVFVVQNSDLPPFRMDGFENTAVPAGMVSKGDGALLKLNANTSATLTAGLHSILSGAVVGLRAKPKTFCAQAPSHFAPASSSCACSEQ
jgi:hypothetical protein